MNATWGVTSLLLGGIIQPVDYLFHWWTWWVGDAIGVITFTPLVLIWLGKPAVFSHGRQVSLPLCLAFTLVVIFFIYTNAWEQDRIKLEFKRRTDQLAQELQENFDDYIDVLHSVENLYASSVPINRHQFKTSSRAGSRAIQGFVQSRGVPGYSTRIGQTMSRLPGKMASVTSRSRNRAHRGSWFGQRGAPNISPSTI